MSANQKPLRMLVFVRTEVSGRTFAKDHQWRNARIFAAKNGKGFWVQQPGKKELFGGDVAVFLNYFNEEVTFPVGYGDNKKFVRCNMALAKSHQWDQSHELVSA